MHVHLASAEVQLRDDAVSHIVSALAPLHGRTTPPSFLPHDKAMVRSGGTIQLGVVLPQHASVHVGGVAVGMVSTMPLFQQLEQPVFRQGTSLQAGRSVDVTEGVEGYMCSAGPARTSGAMEAMWGWCSTCRRVLPFWELLQRRFVCCEEVELLCRRAVGRPWGYRSEVDKRACARDAVDWTTGRC